MSTFAMLNKAISETASYYEALLANQQRNILPEGHLVNLLYGAKLFNDERLFERGEHWFDHRGLKKVGELPILQVNLAEADGGMQLAGDCHDDDI
jgi:hypothetical protein